MCRRDKVDIAAFSFLKLQHEGCKLLNGNCLTLTEMADIVILTENTPKIASRKEDRSRTSCSYQHALFAKMRANGTNHGLFAYAAKTSFSFASKYIALAGTKDTRIHHLT
jgi:uncharacterized membrane protein